MGSQPLAGGCSHYQMEALEEEGGQVPQLHSPSISWSSVELNGNQMGKWRARRPIGLVCKCLPPGHQIKEWWTVDLRANG
jgi:hypothetical protein